MACHLANAQVAPVISKASDGKADSAAGKVMIRVCMPSKSALLQPPPLYVIKSRNEEFKMKSTIGMSYIEPGAIKSILVLKDSVTTSKYGAEAKYGVILVTVNDDKYPDLYNKIKKASRQGN
ncbi:hypothetical protein SAMN04487890_106236 [Mucilaginibacter polytrichastri]|nr:hypothetical protein SAMN04487890_106236 [Mucilaginibacter polytrichastri]